MINRLSLILSVALVFSGLLANATERPLTGATVFNGTPQQIDNWLKILADYGFGLARVSARADNPASGDAFFNAAQKYGLKVLVTISGRPGNPRAEESVVATVHRYYKNPALYGWVVMNEPGRPPVDNPAAIEHYKQWLKDKYQTIDQLNRAWRANYPSFEEIKYDPSWAESGTNINSPTARFFDWYAFWRYYWTWQIDWVTKQVRKVDTVHPTHVNAHMLVTNLAEWSFDLPAWRKVLGALGTSIHPSWHFQLLHANQMALGVSYACDVLRGAAEPDPYYITELQGGNNISSGFRPLGPTGKDIAQWLWTGIGSGPDAVVFHLLNNGLQGNESGEWSLLDLQGHPSDRIEAAGAVNRVLKENAGLFGAAHALDTPVVLLVSLETMTLQERFKNSDYPGRDAYAHVLSVLSYYDVLTELGIPARVKHMHDFDWQAKSATPQFAILPDISAVSAEQAQGIEAFVRNGNSVLLTGLTGFYDEDDRVWPLQKFPLEDLLGATWKDLRVVGNLFQVSLRNPQVTLPAHLWEGEIENHSAEIIGQNEGRVTAIRKKVGKGEAIWIPSLVGLGAWLSDNKPLAKFLVNVTNPYLKGMPFRFAAQQPGCVMRVMKSGESYITVVTNGETESRRCGLQVSDAAFGKVLFGQPSSVSEDGRQISLGPKETTVVLWKRTRS